MRALKQANQFTGKANITTENAPKKKPNKDINSKLRYCSGVVWSLFIW